MSQKTENQPGFVARIGIALANMLIPLQTFAILFYFLARSVGWQQMILVQGLGYILPWLFFPLLFLLPLAWGLRLRVHVAATAVSLLIFALVYGPLFIPSHSVSAAGTSFTVMSYNVLFKNQNTAATLDEIRRQSPDVLALHEYTSRLVAEMDAELSQIYPYQRLERGRGFYSRYPILDYEAVPMPGSFGNAGQKVVLDVVGEPVTVFSVHAAAPGVKTARVPIVDVHLPVAFVESGAHPQHLEIVLEELRQRTDPFVLVGDLNMTDQHVAYEPLMEHLSDAFAERGMGMGFTFTPFSRVAVPVWRIDFVMHSPELTAVSATVGDYAGSDHKPVIATLMLSETSSAESR